MLTMILDYHKISSVLSSGPGLVHFLHGITRPAIDHDQGALRENGRQGETTKGPHHGGETTDDYLQGVATRDGHLRAIAVRDDHL